MKLITDFHIHSHYSLATSSQLTPIYLDYWARIKGLNIIATGDFTHPKWISELQKYLIQSEDGLYTLKSDFKIQNIIQKSQTPHFILSAEISNIYKRDGKVRKVHNVVLAPSFDTVIKIQKYLEKNNFNISSDGRPIIGLDSEKLLEALLEIDTNIIFIPAHIWTPWFSALGSKSGFDSIEQCYGNLSKYIYAVETGLSSDQPLNWLCSSLDKYCLLSNSDAHSPEKLGRNANIFNTEISYLAIKNALENQNSTGFVGTIDMYPQEGKYHYDGHRKCNNVMNPTQTMQNKGICHICGSPLTLGVAHRIAELADRDNPLDRPIRKEFHYIIPLKEILAEIYQLKPESTKIDKIYIENIKKLGNELDILLNLDIETIKNHSGEFIATAIDRLRNNNVRIEEGYDGEYGKIRLFDDNEVKSFQNKSFIFENTAKKEDRKLLNFDVSTFRQLKLTTKICSEDKKSQKNKTDEQNAAINTNTKHSIVVSGPGTGKTFVLTHRITYLINYQKINPKNILAITFSNKAQKELKSRLFELLGNEISSQLSINTFHSLGLQILQQSTNQKFILISENEKNEILADLGINKNEINIISKTISNYKNTLKQFDDIAQSSIFNKYQNILQQNNCIDFDDLIYKTSTILEKQKNYTLNFDFILIDEFQDINQTQYNFIKLLCNQNTSIFAIGDPNQSIYSFRGSDNTIIEQFRKEFDAQVFYLTKSYRCPNTILSFANNIIGSKEKLKGTEKGTKITVLQQTTEKSEAEFIARTISNKIGGTNFFAIDTNVANGNEDKDISSLSDFAILVRTKNLIAPIAKALNDHKIPFTFADTNSVFTSEPFCFINSILKYTINPQNKFFYDVFVAQTQGKYLYKDDLLLTENVQIIWDLFYKKNFSDFQNYFEKYLELTKNKTAIEFLNEIEQMTGQDDIINETEKVKILTMHASKGLEFNCVFIPAFEDNIIPYTIFKKDVDILEEQRLLYVAITRSKKFLYLSFCKSRNLNNLHNNFKPSRFFEMINKKNYEFILNNGNSSEGKQMKLF